MFTGWSGVPRTRWSFSWWFALGCVIGCAASPAPPPTFELEPVPTQPDPGPDVVTIPAGALGPHLVKHADGALFVWALVHEGRTRWFTRPTDSLGRPVEPPVQVAEAPAAAAAVVVRKFAGGAIALSTSQRGDDSFIDVVLFEHDGTLRTSPSAAVTTPRKLIWVDVVSFDKGGLLVWAAQEGPSAALYALAIDGFGQGQGTVVPLHAGASGWQVRRLGDKAVLAVVTVGRELEFITLDAAGQPLLENAVPSVRAVGAELDLVDLDGEMVAAFSAMRGSGRQVFTLRLGPDGGPVGDPLPAVPEWGEQRPALLLKGAAGARYLAWRSPEQFPDTLLLGRLDEHGVVQGTPVEVPSDVGSMLPPLAAWSGGVLALVNPCTSGRAGGACGRTESEAWFFDAALSTKRVQSPLTVGQTPAELTWDPSCDVSGCLGLSALIADEPVVGVVRLAPADGAAVSAATQPSGGPAFERLRTVLSPTEALADFALPAAGGRSLVTLTDFDPSAPYRIPDVPAPDGRKAPVRAIVAAYGLSGDALSAEPTTVISYRARSVSGVSTSHSASHELVVWSALDPKEPQVFVTLLDLQGKKLRQSVLTRSPGEVFSVASAPGPDGNWFVGWVDERGGKSRAHMALVGTQLQRLTRELALGPPEFDATLVELRVVDNELWVLTAGRIAEGGDAPFVVGLQRFARIGLAPVGAFSVLARSAAPLASVAFAAGSGNAAIWVRDGQGEIALLGDGGEPVLERTWIGAPGLTYVAASCAQSCRLVGVARQPPGSAFFTAQLDADKSTVPTVAVRSADPAAAAFRPHLTESGALWYYDTAPDGAPRLNEALLRWSSGPAGADDQR